MAFIIDGSTGIATVDGSVLAPSQRGQDSNSGISYAADTIKFSTNGVERLAITNTGLSGDGSGLTGISAGITMADQWRRTANVSLNNSDNYLTTDWERIDGSGQGTLPVSTDTSNLMQENGGIFTFPSTGIYKVEWQCYFEDTDSSSANAVSIYITTDDNSYNSRAIAFTSAADISTYNYCSAHCQTFVDVTDKTQVKVKFRVYSSSSVVMDASSSENRNCATFIRLGDT
tara:strand:+ start:171 stop:860 length:690 start_codon:yes stop_codon:yes gene_type:complete